VENHTGWKTEISGFRKWVDLPEIFREYINYIETELNVPVTVVSLGPNREQTIVRKAI
jgi:adenylosuccinate synthase